MAKPPTIPAMTRPPTIPAMTEPTTTCCTLDVIPLSSTRRASHTAGQKVPRPLNVIVSGSGHINLAERVFWTPGVRALILTTARGQAHLLRQCEPPTTEVRVLPGQEALRPLDIASTLYGEYGVNLLLHEGGPTFFSAFLTTRLVDELFLTIAPQIVGSGFLKERPSFAVAVNFDAQEALQGNLLSVKRPDSGDHLYLRYRLSHDL